ncbi:class I SAM-dependent methyltransferase [Bdellovibrio sp. HCB-162]|uniref:class I SAM-dependent methyltransferase n=1 Tax=Bdellovibrio sp. HCB-162 TaxID=3394234 RepID=UPI0039BCDD99
MSNSTYWKQRLKKHGHTGWGNAAVYVFDQKYRLDVIKKFILDNFSKVATALDYGCGVGDFAKCLSPNIERIVAVDIDQSILDVAKVNNSADNIDYISQDDFFKIGKDSFDLIYTVTVLQHVTNKEDLLSLIEKFNELLKKNGHLLVYESFSNKNGQSFYQRTQSVAEWERIFSELFYVKYKIITRKSFEDFKSEFLAFQRKPAVRMLSRISNIVGGGIANRICLSWLKILLPKQLKFELRASHGDIESGMVLLVMEKRNV